MNRNRQKYRFAYALSSLSLMMLFSIVGRSYATEPLGNTPVIWYRPTLDPAEPVNVPLAAPDKADAVHSTSVTPLTPDLPPPQNIPREKHLPQRAGRYNALIDEVAAEYRLDPRLLHAIIHTESAYNIAAISPKGAIGLMQVMPKTGQRFGFTELNDPAVNIRAGAHYLKWLLGQFNNDIELALAAYNAGEGAVNKYGQIPPYAETKDYVAKVMARYQKDSGALGVETPLHEPKPSAAPSRPTTFFSMLGRLASLLLSSPPARNTAP